MIKIKLKQNGLLGEASIRYLVDRFKLPQEFAEQVNSQYTQNSDTLLEIYISQYGRPDKRTEKPDVQDLTREFSFWMDRIGKRIDAVLKRTPKLKKEFLELSNEDYPLFVSYVNSKFFKNSLPDDFVREVKQNYRDNWEELIEVYSYYNFDKTPKNFQTSFDNFMRYNDGNDIDAAFKKEPNSKLRLIKLLYLNRSLFLDDIMRIAHGSEGQEELVLDVGDGYNWYNLKTEYCTVEARRMGHCGKAGYGGTLYSLRKEKSNAKEGEDKDTSYVTIEFREDTKNVYQIKGPQNTFPREKFWPYIYKFFDHFGIKEDNVRESLVSEHEDFLKYFNQDQGERSLESELLKIKELSDKARKDDTDLETNTDLYKKVKVVMKRYDLSIEQYVELFKAFRGADVNDPMGYILDAFFKMFEREYDINFKIDILSGVVDYLESIGKFNTPEVARKVSGVIISTFRFMDYVKKDPEKGTTVQQLLKLPVMQKVEAVVKASEEKEKQEKLKEQRRIFSRIKFMTNQRGYFRYVKN